MRHVSSASKIEYLANLIRFTCTKYYARFDIVFSCSVQILASTFTINSIRLPNTKEFFTQPNSSSRVNGLNVLPSIVEQPHIGLFSETTQSNSCYKSYYCYERRITLTRSLRASAQPFFDPLWTKSPRSTSAAARPENLASRNDITAGLVATIA